MIPSLNSGSYVSLPDSLMVEFVDYYMFKNKKNQIINRVQIELDAESISDHEIISFNRPFIFAPDNIFVKQSNDIQLEIDLHQIQTTSDLPKINSANEFEFEYHIVKSRESISEIAENYHVNIEDLISWNEIDSNQQLRTGTVIRIKN
jgi:LysM repeat protein